MSSKHTEKLSQVVLSFIEGERSGNLDAALNHFTEESVLYTPEGLKHGLDAIRTDLAVFTSNVPASFWEAFEIVQMLIDSDIVHLIWKAEPFISLGADVFVIRNEKIMKQTYAFYAKDHQILDHNYSKMSTPQTEVVLQAIEAESRGDVETSLHDFSEEAVLFTPNGLKRGAEALREDLANFIDDVPDPFWEALEIYNILAEDDLVHIIWKGDPFISFGTDTFVVRNGKVMVQTYAFYPAL